MMGRRYGAIHITSGVGLLLLEISGTFGKIWSLEVPYDGPQVVILYSEVLRPRIACLQATSISPFLNWVVIA
jgi:hypothetical protein